MKRSYKQNCALANALDIVGERWTLLIVRELLIGPRRYGELLENLAGMGTNLLASRLKDMAAADLIVKQDGSYTLTETGTGLEDVVHALVRFALPLGVTPEPDYLHRSEWDSVALAALYDKDKDPGLNGCFQLVLDGVPFSVDAANKQVSVSPGTCDDPQASVALERKTARRLASGDVSIATAIGAGEVEVSGQKAAAKKLLRALSITD